MGPAGGGQQPARDLLPQHVRPEAQAPGGGRAAHLPRDDPRTPLAGDDRARAGRRYPGDRPLLLVARVRRGLGRIRRAARRRDGDLFLGHDAPRGARRSHPVRRAARRGHGDQRVRMDARRRNPVPRGSHTRLGDPRRGAGGSLPGVAGAGAVLRPGAPGDPPAAVPRGAGLRLEVRHQGVSRPAAARRRDSVAEQLTTGPGYDYQPDWSSDGRAIAFARYANDAIELELLDLTAGTARALTANGAVNVEPRWSPDGKRLAFVSSLYNRRWHIFIADPESGAITRVTEDQDSGLPRYYYSRWDHYLSPTWSPDGSELLFVSNRGHIHGTGGFWRMAARPGAVPREVRYEETTWKAHPDWGPDGRRIVYSSYLGGQWHQF